MKDLDAPSSGVVGIGRFFFDRLSLENGKRWRFRLVQEDSFSFIVLTLILSEGLRSILLKLIHSSSGRMDYNLWC